MANAQETKDGIQVLSFAWIPSSGAEAVDQCICLCCVVTSYCLMFRQRCGSSPNKSMLCVLSYDHANEPKGKK